MDLVPVTRGELESGTIVVDQTRRQRIGVRSAPAQPRPLTLDLRAVGEVTYDETRLTDVNLRVSGWVEKLVVDKTGQPVKKGQTLFTLYSPELYTTQLEYLAVAGKSGSTTVSELARVTRTKLSLLGMTAGQIRALERRGTGQENVAFASPASGYVLEKNIVEGARIESGTQVYRIADLSQVWVDAQVYEPDLPYVHVGQPARVELPYVPGRTYEGKVDFIYPTLEEATRTGKVRIVVDNPELELKPQMYASVVFEVDLGERLAVPVSAVVFTGPRRLVFVDLGEGRLRPQAVELGARTEGWYEVTDGLEAGDIVVTSGTFLIAAESRLRSALEFWEGEPVDARQ
jgi:Cu(I)/Ag(I) efflux system membrane fusion protein